MMTQTTKTYYHLYHTRNPKAVTDANPLGIVHQRGVHVKTDKPVRVKCPMTGAEMVLATFEDHDTHAHLIDENTKEVVKRNGKRVFPVVFYDKTYHVVHGDPIIYEAVGHEDIDQTAELAKEWEA